MARPRKEGAEDNLQESTTQDTQLGFNKEYIEYRVEVTPHFKDNPVGGQYLHKYTGEILKKLKANIRIEDFRAEQLNRQWFNTKKYLLEVGSEQTTFETIVKP